MKTLNPSRLSSPTQRLIPKNHLRISPGNKRQKVQRRSRRFDRLPSREMFFSLAIKRAWGYFRCWPIFRQELRDFRPGLGDGHKTGPGVAGEYTARVSALGLHLATCANLSSPPATWEQALTKSEIWATFRDIACHSVDERGGGGCIRVTHTISLPHYHHE